MILADLEDNKLRENAGPVLRLPERVVRRSVASELSELPDYTTSQLQIHPKDPSNDEETVHEKDHAARGARRSFCRAVVLSFLIWAVVSTIIAVPIFLKFRNKSRFRIAPPYPVFDDGDVFAASMESTDIFASVSSKCNIWKEFTDSPSESHFIASQQYTFPVGSLYLRSNQSCNATDTAPISSLFVGINPDSAAREPTIRFSMQTNSLELRTHTRVCFEDGLQSRTALSIYVPSDLKKADSASFNISVFFPQAIGIRPTMKSLATSLPMFTQTFGDLASHVSFQSIAVVGQGSEINVQSIEGNRISMKTSLAPIRGTFNASQYLSMDTIGAPIHANITLVQNPSTLEPTTLFMDTGNSDIRTNITLSVPPSSSYFIGSKQPHFGVYVRTFSGPLTVNLAHEESTATVALQMEVSTSLGNVSVALDKKYQGTFDVNTKLASANVVKNDVEGQVEGRRVLWDYRSDERQAGWVGSGERPKSPYGQGNVLVYSSISPVELSWAT